MAWPAVDGAVLAASDINAIVPDTPFNGTTYTPALTAVTTNPTLGTGALQVGRAYRVGKMVNFHMRIDFGTSGIGVGSGAYRFNVPYAIRQDWIDRRFPCAWGQILDISVPWNYLAAAYPIGATTFEMVVDGGVGVVTHGAPYAWAASDRLYFSGFYEAA